MNATRTLRIGCLLLVAGWLAFAGDPTVPATAGTQVSPSWHQVELGVNKLLILDGKLEMTRTERTYRGEGPHAGRTLTLIKTESDVAAFGSSLGSVTTFSWIDPDTGATVEFKEIKPGKRVKQMLFTADGYRELQFRPEEGKEDTAPETWPKTRDHSREYRLNDGSPVPAGQPVRDYYNMVADLGRREGIRGAEYYVATKGRVIKFEVVFGETAGRTLELEDLQGGEPQSVSLQLRRMDLKPWNEDPEDIGGFFAMKGGTEIWLESRTGMLAVIAGEMPGVPGRTEILLQGAGFQGHALAEALASGPAAP
jgi:hypothetical protein